MARPVALIIGAGPGLSGALARRFADSGHDIALVGIDRAVLMMLTDELTGCGATVEACAVDVADASAASASIAELLGRVGRVDILHFNPSVFRNKDAMSVNVAELLQDVAVGVGALLTSVQAARPWMREGTRITVTGSMVADEPWEAAATLGVQKAGVRNLVRSLDATLRSDGIRAVSITVRGSLASDGPFSQERVAAAIHAAAQQPFESWSAEVVYAG
jgi:NADP-dependent 3-hydroxy acid dehydrogenase YdfG